MEGVDFTSTDVHTFELYISYILFQAADLESFPQICSMGVWLRMLAFQADG